MSEFGRLNSQAGGPMDVLVNQLGDAIVFRKRGELGGSGTAINAIFNELVGALDDFANAVFTMTNTGDNEVLEISRAATITTTSLEGEETLWRVVDVRDDLAGGIEVRAISAQEIN